ncbi:MAG: metalloregulator ArsR/SmtB family transcription factor [Candidatus Marinimicrobia bacterium]|nr:metalloregulator ArsR/SmtB family transcription factor [Candidatus Neomarinimicrobiota bacterium]
MNDEVYIERARVMQALASPVRLRIVDALRCGERCLCELQPLFAVNKSTLSRHVAALRQAGIVRERREGARVYVRLAVPCILNVFDCVQGVLRAEAGRQGRVAREA